MATRSKLADFEIISRLGSGSFGTVFKVKRFIDENLYVIKNVRIVELSFKEQSEAINEVQILAQLKSPFVVRYYDSFIEKDSLHIVMEFCNRGDLQNLIKKAKDKNVQGLKENVIWNITLQIMLGLHYLHKKHILHRDLKSANVFLMKDETKSHYLVKIGDLGVAKLMDTSTALANTIVGTPYYLSPELCADMPYRDKSDCWALGVLIFECATLQHPFEARNQCALIMKIIEAQVKIPATAVVSSELKNVILWLLQKDPNTRPSIKDVLNERVVRDKLAEHQFELPEELQEARITDALSNPNFEKKENLKKKASGIQLMNMRHEEERRANGTPDKEPRELVKKPSVKPPSTRENSKDALRIGGDSTPVSPSAQKGVRRTGSTTANSELKGEPSQPAAQGLSVAGNGMVGRNGSSGNLAPSPHTGAARVPSFRTTTAAVQGAAAVEVQAVRGDRVRGPSSNKRVTSDKAMNRYQVRPPPPVYGQNSSSRLSDSKLDIDDGETTSQSKEDDYTDAESDRKSLEGDSAHGMDRPQHQTPSKAPSLHHIRSSPGMDLAAADGKETSEYEEDFEEEDPDYQWDKNKIPQIAEARLTSQFSTSRKLTEDDVNGADDKGERRASQADTISRNSGVKIDYYVDDKDTNTTDGMRGTLNGRSLRLAQGGGGVDPFHQTDGSVASAADPSHPYSSTLAGESGMWDPVWTQNRGVIGGRDVGTEDMLYRQTLDAQREEAGAEEDEAEGDIDEDIEYIVDMIEDLKNGAIALLGETLFWKVYDLCAKYMDLPMESASTFNLVQELETILLDGGGSLEVACDVVFKVKSLLAFESRYNMHMENKAGAH